LIPLIRFNEEYIITLKCATLPYLVGLTHGIKLK